MKSDYFERKENRIERLKELSGKNLSISQESYEKARSLADQIPFGQPILVGHHSEKRHRNHIKKIDNAMRANVEALSKAGYYEEKARAAENNTAISSDHPNALQLLKDKLKDLQAAQEYWKAINKAIRTGKTREQQLSSLEKLGVKNPAEYLEPDFCGRIGIPDFQLSNNNGNMARIKKRIEHLERQAKAGEKDIEINGVRILSSFETNRTQIFFPDKPAEQVRTHLKQSGFRWSPTEQAWQKNLSDYAQYQAQEIVNMYYTAQ